MWLFIHIPKTAGTSYRRHLESRLPGRIAYHYGPASSLTHPVLRDTRLSAQDKRASLEELGIEMIFGHLRYPAWREAFAPAEVAAILRHPVDRCISHYQHFLSHRESNSMAEQVRNQGLGLRDFARTEGQRDFQSRLLGVEHETLDMLPAFGSLLLSERLDSAMGSPLRLNTGKRSFAVSAEDIAAIVEANPLDLLIYELLRQAEREGYWRWPAPVACRRSLLRDLFHRA